MFTTLPRHIRVSWLSKMPMIKVSTNLPNDSVPVSFESRLTDVIAESMNKPTTRVAVEVCTGARLLHGGTNDPVAVISVNTIGALSPTDNIRHVQKITALCEELLHLPNNKIAISFHDLDPNNVGFGGTTIAEANKNQK